MLHLHQYHKRTLWTSIALFWHSAHSVHLIQWWDVLMDFELSIQSVMYCYELYGLLTSLVIWCPLGASKCPFFVKTPTFTLKKSLLKILFCENPPWIWWFTLLDIAYDMFNKKNSECLISQKRVWLIVLENVNLYKLTHTHTHHTLSRLIHSCLQNNYLYYYAINYNN